MRDIARFVRVLTVGHSRSPRHWGVPLIPAIMVCAIVSLAAQAQGNTDTAPAQLELEARIAVLKAETAALVAAARHEALSQQQRLSAAPVIFRVPGALTEFKDCADC